MKSISHGIESSRIRSAMKNTAPLQHADEQQVAARVVGRDLGAELGDPRSGPTPRRSGSRRLRGRPRSPGLPLHGRLLAVTTPSQPGATAIPGTATTSPAQTTTGQVSALRPRHLRVHEQILHLLAAPRQVIAGPPGPHLEIVPVRLERPRPPFDRALEPERSVLADGADAAAEIGGLRAGARCEQLRRATPRARAAAAVARRRERAGSPRRRGAAAAAAAGSRPGSALAWSRDSSRRPGPAGRELRSTRVVSSRVTSSSGRTTPSSRRTLIPRVEPLEHDPVEHRLDLIRGRVSRRPEPEALGCRVAQLAHRRLGRRRLDPDDLALRARPRSGRRRRPLRHRARRGGRGRRRRRTRARRARARGTSSRHRPRRGT